MFLVDASGSVGLKNFHSELNFVKHLLADFSVEPSTTTVAIVTFGGRRHIRRNIDQISHSSDNNNKCYLLNKQLDNINYTGGGTYTRGALLEALVSCLLSFFTNTYLTFIRYEIVLDISFRVYIIFFNKLQFITFYRYKLDKRYDVKNCSQI